MLDLVSIDSGYLAAAIIASSAEKWLRVYSISFFKERPGHALRLPLHHRGVQIIDDVKQHLVLSVNRLHAH